jgi:hypothetical protein
MTNKIIDLPESIRERLINLRTSKNYTYSELGTALGFEYKFLYNLMTKKKDRLSTHNCQILKASLDNAEKDISTPMSDIGFSATSATPSNSESVERDSTTPMLEHSYLLRAGVVVKLTLPTDISLKEITRLYLFMQSHAIDY